MEEQQQQQGQQEQTSSFNKESVGALLRALEKNRRRPSGINNFQAQPNQPINEGNPYPDQPLAGRFMGEDNEPR